MIRTYRPGDEESQVAIYNVAAAALPGFQPAKADDIRRRLRSREFVAELRFVAEVDGAVVGYCNAQPNGRVSLPWTLPGQEHLADELFHRALTALGEWQIATASAAYRGDWLAAREFLVRHGFAEVRQMVNFVLSLCDTPTLTGAVSRPITPLVAEDIPALFALAPDVFRVSGSDLENHLLGNPRFAAESVFVMRSRTDHAVVAAGILIDDPSFADPTKIDPAMPCFRLGAFGTEGASVKRVNGLFSFVAGKEADIGLIGMDLLTYAVDRLMDADTEVLAAQVPSDATRLLRFYERFFRKQGSFPVFEKGLGVRD